MKAFESPACCSAYMTGILLNVAESMAFEDEPVDLQMLEAEHARRNMRVDMSKLDLERSPTRS